MSTPLVPASLLTLLLCPLLMHADGHEPQRAYYSGLGEKLPKDTMLLTLGCGKFR
jgi:hydroxylamine reductase (hybrid-cluster protein)